MTQVCFLQNSWMFVCLLVTTALINSCEGITVKPRRNPILLRSEFPWSRISANSHPFLYWTLFYKLPTQTFSFHPSAINIHSNNAENRLFPTYRGKYDLHNRAQHRLFPFHPSQDLITFKVEQRSQSTTNKSSLDHLETTSTTIAPHRIVSPKNLQDLLITNRRKRSAVIFPTDPLPLSEPSSVSNLSSFSNDHTLGKPLESETSAKAEDKKLSLGGKLVMDGLSVIGSLLSPPSRPFLPPPTLGSHASPVPPPYSPFLFPGPSALYPTILPPYPIHFGNHGNYYGMPSPYQALNVDSLLVPLVGLVGLSLLVPEIVKTTRDGRPSDIGGLDAFRRLNTNDEDCLRRFACETGVMVAQDDDPAAIQR